MASHMLKHLPGSLHINTSVSGFPNGRPWYILNLSLRFWFLDRIYKACIRQCWYLHTVAYMYAPKHVHTLMQPGFTHTNFSGSKLFQIQSYLSKTNNLNAAGQYPLKLYMLLILDWADIHPGSVRSCRPIPMQIQFVVIVGQYPSTFCSVTFRYVSRFSCMLWADTHLFQFVVLVGHYPSKFRR